MKIIKINTISLAFLLIPFISSSVMAQVGVDSILFNAMHDEIERGMEHFQYKDFAKPCYISYELFDSKTLDIQAQLGSLVRTDTSSFRGWSFRLIVGSFELNDENFSGQNQQDGGGLGNVPQIFPTENDYFGIRRGFWLNSNDIYLRAGANHREKLNLIEKGKIAKDAIKLADFSRSTPVRMIMPASFSKPAIPALEMKMKALSSAFYDYPALYSSSANLSFDQNIIYYINSEGTIVRMPKNIARISVNIAMETEKDNIEYRSFRLIAKSPESFPSNELLSEEILKLVKDLEASKNAEELEDEYTGPVLLIGPKAADVLIDNLFDNTKSLYAERNDLVVDYNGDVYYEEIDNEWQSRIGKKILPEGISVTALPKLEIYNDVPLMAGYPIDSDGIVPPDSINLVDNGILKNMLSSRTPTSVTDSSNGHYPYVFTYGGISQSRGPSVIRIYNQDGMDEQTLKKKLIELALEEDLEYAVIIRNIPSDLVDMPYNLYKVDLETGIETLIKNARLSRYIETSDMKKIYVGTDSKALNLGASGYNNGYAGSGNLISYIGPTSLLVEEMKVNVSKERDNIHTAGDDITNPLKLVDR